MSKQIEQAYIESAIPNREVSDKILAMIDAFDNSSGGTTSEKYTKTVALSDWVGPSAGVYTLTILFSFHGIHNPNVTCYETNGINFDQVLVPIEINTNNDITITVNETQDARFLGKIVID